MPVTPWRIPAGAWAGEPAFVLGGGPSLDPSIVPALSRRGRVVAVNAAYTIAPAADMLYFADGESRFWKWCGRDVAQLWRGGLIVSAAPDVLVDHGLDIRRLAWERPTKGRPPPPALPDDPGVVTGEDSGAHAVTILARMGCRPIVLFGFDMRGGRWHRVYDAQPGGAGDGKRYAATFLPWWSRLAAALKAAEVEVWNASPGSALTAFPVMTPAEALTRIEERRGGRAA